MISSAAYLTGLIMLTIFSKVYSLKLFIKNGIFFIKFPFAFKITSSFNYFDNLLIISSSYFWF